jgi:hypothetical protein
MSTIVTNLEKRFQLGLLYSSYDSRLSEGDISVLCFGFLLTRRIDRDHNPPLIGDGKKMSFEGYSRDYAAYPMKHFLTLRLQKNCLRSGEFVRHKFETELCLYR